MEVWRKYLIHVFPVVWLWLIFVAWGLFFARPWLGQVYAKVREVKHFGGLSYEDQVAAVYGHEMLLLQEKVSQFSRENEEFLLVVPEKPRLYPIANNAPLLRALTHGKIEIVGITEVESRESGYVFWHPDQFFFGERYPVGIERISLEEVK